jgi:hypothetical protein
MIMPAAPPPFSVQFRIDLLGTERPVWRRIRVPGNLTMVGLHYVIQEAVGWNHAHLFEFSGPTGEKYQDLLLADPEWPVEGLLDAGSTSLMDAFGEGSEELRYEYDFGDSWEHVVGLEDVRVEASRSSVRPLCMDGAGRCPPEDCGGVDSFREMLEALSDPRHEEHESWLAWLGEPFDPDAFHPDEANARLAALMECGWNPSELWRRRWILPTIHLGRLAANQVEARSFLVDGGARWERAHGDEIDLRAGPDEGVLGVASRLVRIAVRQRPVAVVRMRKPAALAAGAFHAAFRMMRRPRSLAPGAPLPSLSGREAAEIFGVSEASALGWSRTALDAFLEHSEEEAFAARAFVGGEWAPGGDAPALPTRGGVA